ncbi:cyclic pyranopterin phosphate synthase [Alteromonadaceae bacterium 2753L.S.0a.02]|nr:cyclic pyranopterin phosphate synthase [Alteromonadaceae bacterium 2753L.S.0a.02]
MITPVTLVDNYQRQFTYLRLSITDACNFRCNYCLPDGYCRTTTENYLSLAEIKKLVHAFASAGIRKIRITGGEPTLRKDLSDIIAVCKTTPGIETVALTSNGYRITKQLPALIDAGLDQLNLSLDSLQPETFKLITGHDKLHELLAGVEQSLQLGLKTKINVVLMREYNGRELQEFLEFVRQRAITLRFIELMQTGDNENFFNAQHVRGEQIQQYLLAHGWSLKPRSPTAGPALEYSHGSFLGSIGLIMPYSKDFCSSCNRLRVSAHGNLHLCLFADAHHKLRPQLTTASEQHLAEQLQQLLGNKRAGHKLHQRNSGSTRQLAMLGG